MGARGLIGSGSILRGLIGSGDIGSGLMEDGGGSSVPYTATPWYGYWSGQETAFQAVNAGGIFFNGTGEARAFGWQALNDSGRTADRVRIPLVNALALASEARVSVGIGGSGYNADTWTTPTAPLAIMASGSSGEYELGVTVVEVDLPSPVANGARIVIRVEGGAGVPWTAISSWTNSAESTIVPAGPQMANPAQDLTGAWTYSSFDLGMIGAGVQWHVTGDPIVRILVGGDSRDAGVTPVVDPTNTVRRSWIAGVNTAEAANGQRFSIASWAEGGYTFDQYCDRLEYLLDNAPATLRKICDIISVDALTWNQFPSTPAESSAIRSRIDTLRTKCLAAQLGFIVHCVTPPGTDRQDSGRLTEYADWQTWFAARPWTVFMAPGVADGTTPTLLDATKSADGVHINSAYGPTHGANYVASWWSAIQAQGA